MKLKYACTIETASMRLLQNVSKDDKIVILSAAKDLLNAVRLLKLRDSSLRFALFRMTNCMVLCILKTFCTA